MNRLDADQLTFVQDRDLLGGCNLAARFRGLGVVGKCDPRIKKIVAS